MLQGQMFLFLNFLMFDIALLHFMKELFFIDMHFIQISSSYLITIFT